MKKKYPLAINNPLFDSNLKTLTELGFKVNNYSEQKVVGLIKALNQMNSLTTEQILKRDNHGIEGWAFGQLEVKVLRSRGYKKTLRVRK